MYAWVTIILIVSLLFFLYKGYKNTKRAVINNVSINDSSTDEHSDGQAFRILHISDMHLENISISPEQLYENLRDQSIDLIALTGDFLDRKRSIPRLLPY